MKRRLTYGLVIVVLLANLAIGARLYLGSAAAAEKDSAYPNLELFSVVMEKIRKDYVDGTNTTYQELVYGALKGMVNTLDPHSEFLEPEKYKELQNDTQGQFGGLGIVVSLKDEYLTVVAPMEDTPGFRAGILTGDRIIKIDGKSTERLGLPEAVKNLRGDPGTEVTITVQRPSTGVTKEMRLMRAIINVDMAKDINGKKQFPIGESKIGYIRLTQFGEKTADELETGLKKLKNQGMQAIILDLRGNPGGLLDQAVDVCEKFLPRGQLVVSTEGRNSIQKYPARGRGDELKNMPMVVLVNGGSASAAEIVAGCLQDVKRAVLLGEKTFGKGSVQSIVPLQNGAALRLTTAKYYTPSHKVIHEHGITPDIEVPISDEEERALVLKRSPGGLETLEAKDREAVEKLRDPQVDRAMDVLKGIMLFTKRAPSFEEQRKNEKIAAASGEETSKPR
ncbi:MAG: S41 family peptidase [Pedosphaera sp.]|nr:S41 family peptidase [Pedosphaera sp.]